MKHFFHKTHNRIKKLAGLFLVVMTLVTSVFVPTAAQAQFGGVVSDPAQIGLQTQMLGRDTAKDTFGNAIMYSMLQGFQFLTEKFAYDTAKYIAHGGKGQGALAFRDGFGAYLENTVAGTVAHSIGEFGKNWGLNLCQVPDLQFELFLSLGLRNLYGPQGPQATCTWRELTDGGLFDADAWRQRYGTEEGLSETFAANLSVENTDFGVALGAVAQLDNLRAEARESATADRQEGQGFRPVTSLISGRIKSPAQQAKINAEALTDKHDAEIRSQQIAGIYGTSFEMVPYYAMSVFFNTLATESLNKLIDTILADEDRDNSDVAFSEFSDRARRSRAQADRAFASLNTLRLEQLNNFPIIGELAACPDKPGLNNCVIDSYFQAALTQAQTDPANVLTIQQALDKGLLKANWPLISPRHQDHNNVKGCQVGKYCYSNIQKLRKLRILPLGFEIAALRSDPERPWTLGEVVAGFDSCKRNPNDPTQVVADPAYPYCHLINPNWIIAAPSARCEANVFGPTLATEQTANRLKECVDIATNIEQGTDNSDQHYGYCTKEKNVWRIPGTTCEPQFSTCKTYTNTANNEVVSYLSRTVEKGQCNADVSGCRVYSLEAVDQTTSTWKSSVAYDENLKNVGRNQFLYLDNDHVGPSNSCSADSAGCSALFVTAKYPNGQFATTETGAYQKSERREYVQVAPDYLGCYDTDAGTTGNQWPTTLSQVLNDVSTSASCEEYASACIAEEVGCNAYTPVAGAGAGEVIPGKIGAQNVCSQECVGYETFRQLGYKDNADGYGFESAPEDLMHFIPRIAEQNMQQDGLVCNADVVGCDEFTNLDEVALGGEGLEYYNKIKYCERPAEDESNIQTYYSWEGSITEGYTLKTHRLRPIDAEDVAYYAELGVGGDMFVQNSPRYADDRADVLQEYVDTCNEATYNDKINNGENPAPPECHALYDRDGNIFYRILEDTVTVSAECHPLRKTTVDTYVQEGVTADMCDDRGGQPNGDNSCTRCVGGGEFQEGVCVYWAMTGENESQSCPATANQCRAYTGNTANNVQQVFYDQFEPAGEDQGAINDILSLWVALPGGSVSIVSEAADVGLHSIQIEGKEDIARYISTSTQFMTGVPYELSFWSKGIPQNLTITLQQEGEVKGSFTLEEGQSIGSSWRSYQLGPVELQDVDNDKPMELHFESSGQAYFLDNLRLTRTQDTLYLIKDSWKSGPEFLDVPRSCDSVPNDGLPGEALGCQAYQEGQGEQQRVRYATGFERLCRPKAIGCQPVWDTQNTLTGPSPEQARVYNVWCAGNGGESCTVTYNEGEDDAYELGSCTVIQGETGCFVKQNDSLGIPLPEGMDLETLKDGVPQSAIQESTVYIPADTAADEPLFLSLREEFECDEREMGCEKAGLQEQVNPEGEAPEDFTHSEVIIKNSPGLYDTTLCNEEVLYCAEYNTTDAGPTYFKDPKLEGNAVCEWRERTGNQAGGWYRTDADDNLVPCYPTYRVNGGDYGIYSSQTDSYDNYVASCPNEANQCTEIIDHADTSNLHPDGKPYYVIFDQFIEDRLSECNQVSQREGCVLFDRTDRPNKVFSTELTYDKSENNVIEPYGLVDPVDATQDNNQETVNDANLILKVNRDRECSEWLSCRTSVPIQTKSGETQQACYQLQACKEFEDDGSTCKTWVDEQDSDEALFELDYQSYITRDVSWNGEDYSGYSLYNGFQITNFRTMIFDFPDAVSSQLQDEANTIYLVREIKPQVFSQVDAEEQSCIEAPDEDKNWQSCGFDAGGLCYEERCIYPIDGPFENEVDPNNLEVADLRAVINELTPNQCKGVPEQDSPFSSLFYEEFTENNTWLPEGVKKARRNITQKKDGYENANVCQDGACSCTYTKITYENGETDYWPVGGNQEHTAPLGICEGGEFDGHGCNPSDGNACGEEGRCLKQESKSVEAGMMGFCLEYDYSRPNQGDTENGYPCLTWLPVQASISRFDVFNSDPKAGYYPELDAPEGFGALYCAEGTNAGNAIGTTKYLKNVPADAEILDRDCEGGGIGACIQENGENMTPEKWLEIYSVDEYREHQRHGMADPNTNDHLRYLYSYYQSWAWEKLGKNAILLRFEHDPDGRPNETNWYGTVRRENDNSIDGEERSIKTIYAFHPNNGYGNEHDAETRHEFGVIMHPPRIFQTFEDEQINGERNSYDAVASLDAVTPNYALAPDQTPDEYIISTPMSPEYNTSNEGNEAHNTLYVSSLEKNLNEYDIDKFYLVPFHSMAIENSRQIDYPKLNPNSNPADTGNVAQIDFPGVREGENNALASTIQDFHADEGRDLLVWSYYMSRNQDSYGEDFDQFGYTNYNHFVNNANVNFPNEIDERNEIYSRYVMVFADWTGGDCDNCVPTFINVDEFGLEGENRAQAPTGPEQDPFSVACSNVEVEGNWFALGLDFNADGEFLGYVSRACQDKDEHFGLMFMAAATVHDHCRVITQTYSEENILKETNKAWTNRIWQQASTLEQNSYGPRRHPVDPFTEFFRRNTTPQQPFGSLSISVDSITDNGVGKDLRKQAIFADSSNGIPYACTGNWGGGISLYNFGRCNGLLSAGYSQEIVNGVSRVQNQVQGMDAIQQLFAKLYAVGRFTEEDQTYASFTGSIDNRPLDIASQEELGLHPPRIYAPHPYECSGTGDNCSAVEADNITINWHTGQSEDYNDDDVVDEDVTGDGIADPIIAQDSYFAVARFFAFADDNRMPIRRVLVDWGYEGGDYTTPPNENQKGFYKNRKPVCEPNESPEPEIAACSIGDELTGVTAKVGEISCPAGEEIVSPDDLVAGDYGDEYQSKRFGNVPRACEPGYFEFIHEYTCSPADIAAAADGLDMRHVTQVSSLEEPTRALLATQYGVGEGDYVCIYQPRVQVLDNWGWCNGSCEGNENGCYSEFPRPGEGPLNQCNSGFNDETGDYFPWTPYQGEIIVVPSG